MCRRSILVLAKRRNDALNFCREKVRSDLRLFPPSLLLPNMLISYIVFCIVFLDIVAAFSSSSSRTKQSRRDRRAVRLFGVDLNNEEGHPIESSSVVGTYDNPIDVSSYEESNRPPMLDMQYEIANLDGLVAARGLEDLLNDPRFTKDQKEALMERHLPKYNFNVLDPTNMGVEAVSLYKGHGRDYYIGHELAYERIRKEVTKNFPDMTASQVRKKLSILKSLDASQQAMRFLLASPEAAILHEPSGKIFLSPKIRHNQDMLQSIWYRWNLGLLPKLRYKDGRMHFKTSNEQKRIHRNPGNRMRREDGAYDGGNERTMEEETSSEGE